MAHTLEVVTTVKVNGSQVMGVSRDIEVEATDAIAVTILGKLDPSGPDLKKELELQPTNATDRVTFVGITADRYDGKLTYTVNTDTSASVSLDEPQVLFGKGAVGLLDTANAPTKLFFSSDIDDNAEIQILIGRDATPPPSA